MNIISKVFIGAYLFLKKQDRQDARFSAVAILTAIQILTILIPLLIVKVIFHSDFFSVSHDLNKILVAPIPILWIILNYQHYSKRKIENLVSEYDGLSLSEQRIWNWAHIFILIFWSICFLLVVFLNKKYRG